MYVYLSVCLSAFISKTTHPNSFQHVTSGCGLVLWLQCNMLCTIGFVMFHQVCQVAEPDRCQTMLSGGVCQIVALAAKSAISDCSLLRWNYSNILYIISSKLLVSNRAFFIVHRLNECKYELPIQYLICSNGSTIIRVVISIMINITIIIIIIISQ